MAILHPELIVGALNMLNKVIERSDVSEYGRIVSYRLMTGNGYEDSTDDRESVQSIESR